MSTSPITVSLASTEGWTCASNYLNVKTSTRRTKIPRCEFNIDGIYERMSYSMFLKLELADGFKYKLNKIENKWYRNSIVNEESQDEEKLIQHPLEVQSGRFWKQSGINFNDVWSSTRAQKKVDVVMKTLRLYKVTLVVRDTNGKKDEFHFPTHQFITVSPPPAKRKVTEEGEVQEPKVKRAKKNQEQDRGQCKMMKSTNNDQHQNSSNNFAVPVDAFETFQGDYQVGFQQEEDQAQHYDELYEERNGFQNQEAAVIGHEGFIYDEYQVGAQDVYQDQYYANYQEQNQFMEQNLQQQGPMFNQDFYANSYVDYYDEIMSADFNGNYDVQKVNLIELSEEENASKNVQNPNEPITQSEEENGRKSFEGCSEEERQILSEFLVL